MTQLASISFQHTINHFTYHVPSPKDDGPRPDMATSTTPGGVQSVSTWLEVMHVLHKRREKHLGELVVAEEKEIFPASAASDGTLRNAHRLADELRVPANENKRSGGEEEGVAPA